MNVKKIVKKYLEDNGYDGLYSDECGCKLDDLGPCILGVDMINCQAGYISPCDPETCPADGDCEWHIGPKGE